MKNLSCQSWKKMAILILFTMDIGRTKNSRYKFWILTFILHIYMCYQNFNYPRSIIIHLIIILLNILSFSCLYMFVFADSNSKKAVTLQLQLYSIGIWCSQCQILFSVFSTTYFIVSFIGVYICLFFQNNLFTSEQHT